MQAGKWNQNDGCRTIRMMIYCLQQIQPHRDLSSLCHPALRPTGRAVTLHLIRGTAHYGLGCIVPAAGTAREGVSVVCGVCVYVCACL